MTKKEFKEELRVKALELACSVAKNDKAQTILANAYMFYDFLENDVEFSIKGFNFPESMNCQKLI